MRASPPAKVSHAPLAALAILALLAGCKAQEQSVPSPTVAVVPAVARDAGPAGADDFEGSKCSASLVEIARRQPSPEAFDALLEAVRSKLCARARAQAIAQADLAVAAWPDEVRRAPEAWKPFEPQEDEEIWRLVRHADIPFTKVTEEWIRSLERPHLAHLTSISISFHAFPDKQAVDRGAKAIAEGKMLTGLRSLHIGLSGLTDDGARAIAGSTTLTRLTHLALDYNDIGDEGAKALAVSGALAGLTTLNLSKNSIGADGARALAGPSALPRLTTLLLGGNYLGTEGAKAIAASPLLGRLVRLDLELNLIGAEGAAALCAPGAAPHLAELSLRYNFLGDEGAKAIAASKSMTALKALNLSSNEIGDDGAKALAASPALPRDAGLDLTINGIGDGAEAGLKAAFPRVKLERDPTPRADGIVYASDFAFPPPRGKEVQRSKVDPPKGLPRDVRFRRLMNARFNFAVDFPTFLVPQEPPGNGDGRSFRWGREIEMLAWGDNNNTMQPIGELFRDAMKEAGKGATGSLSGDTYTLTRSAEGKTVHRRTTQRHGRNVSVLITHDASMKAYFAPIVKSIFDSLRIHGPPM